MKKKNKAGFLLVEIIIALSVVALVLGALLQVVSHALRNSNEAKTVQLACYLAEKKIWETLWEDPIQEGWTNGVFKGEPSVTWSQEITLLYRPPQEEEEEEEEKPVPRSPNRRAELPPTDLYQIRVFVNWFSQGKEKNFELATYRLAPTPESKENDDEGS